MLRNGPFRMADLTKVASESALRTGGNGAQLTSELGDDKKTESTKRVNRGT